MNRKILCLALIALMVACNTTPTQSVEAEVEPPHPQTPTDPKQDHRDFRNFTLAAEVQEAAPYMQQQLYQLIRLNTNAFKVKPAFAFLDQDQVTYGAIDFEVSRLNMLHIAYWQNEQHVWSGSLMVGVGKGWSGTTRRGHQLKLGAKGDQCLFSFQGDKGKVSDEFHNDTPHKQWYDLGEGAKVFVYYYTFPREVVLRNPDGSLAIPQDSSHLKNPNNAQKHTEGVERENP